MEKNKTFLQWFKQYNHSTLLVIKKDQPRIQKTCQKVLDFFCLQKSFTFDFVIHLNLLESYRRGTNYLCARKKIVSTSLTPEQQMDERSVRHEMMHLLLNTILPSDKVFSHISFPVSSGYTQDGPRVQFEENFIQAANLFFLSDEQHRRQLKYFEHLGFKRIKKFDIEIGRLFIEQKRRLGALELKKLIMQCSKPKKGDDCRKDR